MATINDFARMCNANDSCKTCLIKAEMKKLYILECQGYIRRYPNEASDIIDKWCAEHPQKTYLEDFFAKFPNALKEDDGMPLACRENVYGTFHYGSEKVPLCYLFDDDCEEQMCTKCWNEVMPEE